MSYVGNNSGMKRSNILLNSEGNLSDLYSSKDTKMIESNLKSNNISKSKIKQNFLNKMLILMIVSGLVMGFFTIISQYKVNDRSEDKNILIEKNLKNFIEYSNSPSSTFQSTFKSNYFYLNLMTNHLAYYNKSILNEIIVDYYNNPLSVCENTLNLSFMKLREPRASNPWPSNEGNEYFFKDENIVLDIKEDDNSNKDLDKDEYFYYEEEAVDRKNINDLIAKRKPPLLFSARGSGTSIFRTFLEYFSGAYSGSVGTDDTLMTIFEGEQSCNIQSVVIHGHPFLRPPGLKYLFRKYYTPLFTNEKIGEEDQYYGKYFLKIKNRYEDHIRFDPIIPYENIMNPPKISEYMQKGSLRLDKYVISKTTITNLSNLQYIKSLYKNESQSFLFSTNHQHTSYPYIFNGINSYDGFNDASYMYDPKILDSPEVNYDSRDIRSNLNLKIYLAPIYSNPTYTFPSAWSRKCQLSFTSFNKVLFLIRNPFHTIFSSYQSKRLSLWKTRASEGRLWIYSDTVYENRFKMDKIINIDWGLRENYIKLNEFSENYHEELVNDKKIYLKKNYGKLIRKFIIKNFDPYNFNSKVIDVLKGKQALSHPLVQNFLKRRKEMKLLTGSTIFNSTIDANMLVVKRLKLDFSEYQIEKKSVDNEENDKEEFILEYITSSNENELDDWIEWEKHIALSSHEYADTYDLGYISAKYLFEETKKKSGMVKIVMIEEIIDYMLNLINEDEKINEIHSESLNDNIFNTSYHKENSKDEVEVLGGEKNRLERNPFSNFNYRKRWTKDLLSFLKLSTEHIKNLIKFYKSNEEKKRFLLNYLISSTELDEYSEEIRNKFSNPFYNLSKDSPLTTMLTSNINDESNYDSLLTSKFWDDRLNCSMRLSNKIEFHEDNYLDPMQTPASPTLSSSLKPMEFFLSNLMNNQEEEKLMNRIYPSPQVICSIWKIVGASSMRFYDNPVYNEWFFKQYNKLNRLDFSISSYCSDRNLIELPRVYLDIKNNFYYNHYSIDKPWMDYIEKRMNEMKNK